MADNTDSVFFLRNLKGYAPEKEAKEGGEYPLYTDARIVGELTEGCEPYFFLNALCEEKEPGVVVPSIILRIFWYVSEDRAIEVRTDASRYHGGLISDEIAALASLKLGIRLKAGGLTRIFGGFSQDPFGTPWAVNRSNPELTIRSKRLVLPNVVKEVNLANLAELKALKNLEDEQYISLVRAARLYQDALWIAESEPALAWLMLISAAETAANQWSADEAPPSERLRASKPKLAEILINCGGEDLLVQVAEEIASSLGATKKFIDFCLKFMPDPPANRPDEWGQVKWETSNLKKILGKLYGYRSKALHGGTPFPAPMCQAPERLSSEQVEIEIGSFGLAVHTLGGSWLAEDLPVNMNTFNYMVNGILNKWWTSLVSIKT